MDSFGLHIVSPTKARAYKNGEQVAECYYPTGVGDKVMIAAASAGPPHPYPHVDRIEIRDEPGGTLLFADDFDSLTGWATGWDEDTTSGNHWKIDPASHAFYPGGGDGIYRTQPAAAAYVELQGVYFDPTGSTSPDWVMVILSRSDPFLAPTNPEPDGDGYRVLMTPEGTVALAGCTPRRGFCIGCVPIGAT